MTILDSAALDVIARCLHRLTMMSGLSAAECLATLEEYSQPLTPSERSRVLVWYDFRCRESACGDVH